MRKIEDKTQLYWGKKFLHNVTKCGYEHKSVIPSQLDKDRMAKSSSMSLDFELNCQFLTLTTILKVSNARGEMA